MSRTLPTGYAALAAARVFRPVFLVDLDWPSGIVYLWGGYGTMPWGGNTYVGTGHLGGVSTISESFNGRANGVTLTLSGIPSALLADALAVDSQGRRGRVWLAALANDGSMAADPYLIFDGVIDICPVSDDGSTASITVQLEKELIDRRVNNWRYTHEDQQIDSPGDLIFSFVAGLANAQFHWGGKALAPPDLGGSGSGPTGSGPTGPGGNNSGPSVNYDPFAGHHGTNSLGQDIDGFGGRFDT